MRNRDVISMVLMALLLVNCGNKGKKLVKNQRPNIIFLMDDQHRWDAMGFVNEQVKTPTLDKLAQEGLYFSQAVCQAPMCIASRNSMMLGLYPNQIGVLRNEPGIPDGQLPNKTLPQVLLEAGYETAGFGKTHWGVVSSTRGFETRYIGECLEKGAQMMANLNPEGKAKYDTEIAPYGPGEEAIAGYIGETSKLAEIDHRDGWVFNQCVNYIKKRQDERPLFLYLSFLKPHAGHNVPEGFEDNYDQKQITVPEQPQWSKDESLHAQGVNKGRGKEVYADFWSSAQRPTWQEMTMRYYANCTWIDDMFGRTLKALEAKGLLKNALIVYVSDHGEMLGERYYRFNKYCLYESSVRVPMIFSGSAVPQSMKHKTDLRPAELVDVYPTLISAAGVTPDPTLPGINLLSEDTREANFCALHERPGEASFMWRTSTHKLILCFKRKKEVTTYTQADIIGGEFYDLENDPREWDDLFSSKIKQKDTMTMALLNHLTTIK